MALQFPSLAFSQDSIRTITSLADLTKCTRLGLRNGYYEHLKLIDRDGNVAQVSAVKTIRHLPPRTFGDIIGWLEANPKYEISLEFENLPPVSLAETKQLILRCFEQERELWEEMIDLGDFEQAVNTAESFDQLFGAFQQFHV